MEMEGSIEGLEIRPGENKEQIVQEIEAAIERIQAAPMEQQQGTMAGELENLSETSFGLLKAEFDLAMPEFRTWLRKELTTNQ